MNYEIIKGQDHEYWLYDNGTDLYYPTGYSWNKVSEEELIKILEREGTRGAWLDMEFDV